MNSNRLLICLFTASAILSGCATTDSTGIPETPSYLKAAHLDPATNSTALVVAHAAGIRGLSDTTLSNRDIAAAQSDNSKAIDNSIALAQAGTDKVQGAGLDPVSALVLGSTIGWLTTDSTAKEDRVFAWMPQGMAASATEAQTKFDAMIIGAFEKAVSNLDGQPKYLDKSAYSGMLKWYRSAGAIDSEKHVCDSKSCKFTFITQKPDALIPSPSLVNAGTSWVFSASDVHSEISFAFPDKNQNFKISLIAEMSKGMPDWAFIYIAPKELKIDGKNVTTPPLVFNRGKVLLFEKP